MNKGNKHFILDFNEPINFSLAKVGKYNVNTIYENIDKFKRFMNESVVSERFEMVYNTILFQTVLWEDDTCTLDNLTSVYNCIASGDIYPDILLPQITEKDMKRELMARGFVIYKSKIAVARGVYQNVYKVKKETNPYEDIE